MAKQKHIDAFTWRLTVDITGVWQDLQGTCLVLWLARMVDFMLYTSSSG